MQIYRCKATVLPGSGYKEIWKGAREIYKTVSRRTKRKPYVRSAFFNGRKVFFDNFWVHLAQKRQPVRRRRLKFFRAALEVVEKSHCSKPNPNKKSETLHRFSARTKDGVVFFLQIKETKKGLQLMSMFGEK